MCECVKERRAAKDAKKKKKAEQDKAAQEASQGILQKKDKCILVEEDTAGVDDNPPQPRQQPLKRGRSSLSPIILESIPEAAEEEPAKKARAEQPLTLSRPTSSRVFSVNTSEDFQIAMDQIVNLATAAKGFVKFIGDVESRNVALELDLTQKNKLIEEGKTELARLRSFISDLETARTSSAEVIKGLRASETKLKADLESARKETEDVREATKQTEAEKEAEEVLGGVEDGYERFLKHIRATIPDIDLSEFTWNSIIVDGKVVKRSAPLA